MYVLYGFVHAQEGCKLIVSIDQRMTNSLHTLQTQLIPPPQSIQTIPQLQPHEPRDTKSHPSPTTLLHSSAWRPQAASPFTGPQHPGTTQTTPRPEPHVPEQMPGYLYRIDQSRHYSACPLEVGATEMGLRLQIHVLGHLTPLTPGYPLGIDHTKFLARIPLARGELRVICLLKCVGTPS